MIELVRVRAISKCIGVICTALSLIIFTAAAGTSELDRLITPMDRPLAETLYELFGEQMFAKDSMVRVHLQKISKATFGREFDQIPAHEFMTSAFFDRTANWNKQLQRGFRHLMARAGFPINLTPAELNAFRHDPALPIFASLDSLGSLEFGSSPAKLARNYDVTFVIDAVKSLLNSKPNDFKTTFSGAWVHEDLKKHLGFPIEDALDLVNSQTPAQVPTTSEQCKAALLESFDTKDLVLELFKRFYPNGAT